VTRPRPPAPGANQRGRPLSWLLARPAREQRQRRGCGALRAPGSRVSGERCPWCSAS
jgi:hypothetical protein